jgi:hypothetical protein
VVVHLTTDFVSPYDIIPQQCKFDHVIIKVIIVVSLEFSLQQ